VTLILPVVAVPGTVTVNCVADALIIEAITPLNFTIFPAADALKFVPSIITCALTIPLAGVKFVIVGAFTVGGGGGGGGSEGSLVQLKMFTRTIIMKNRKLFLLVYFNILFKVFFGKNWNQLKKSISFHKYLNFSQKLH
jgi:hypothetical protein